MVRRLNETGCRREPGLFAADGTQRVRLNGPMVADPVWWYLPLGALIGGTAGLLWGLGGGMLGGPKSASARKPHGKAAIAALIMTGAGLVPLGILQGQMLLQWSRNPLDWMLPLCLCAPG